MGLAACTDADLRGERADRCVELVSSSPLLALLLLLTSSSIINNDVRVGLTGEALEALQVASCVVDAFVVVRSEDGLFPLYGCVAVLARLAMVAFSEDVVVVDVEEVEDTEDDPRRREDDNDDDEETSLFCSSSSLSVSSRRMKSCRGSFTASASRGSRGPRRGRNVRFSTCPIGCALPPLPSVTADRPGDVARLRRGVVPCEETDHKEVGTAVVVGALAAV